MVAEVLRKLLCACIAPALAERRQQKQLSTSSDGQYQPPQPAPRHPAVAHAASGQDSSLLPQNGWEQSSKQAACVAPAPARSADNPGAHACYADSMPSWSAVHLPNKPAFAALDEICISFERTSELFRASR